MTALRESGEALLEEEVTETEIAQVVGPLDRHPRVAARRVRVGEARTARGRAARARHRAGRAGRRGRQRGASLASRAVRPGPSARLVPVPRSDRCRQDGARPHARRVPLRRRAGARAHRHGRVPGEALDLAPHRGAPGYVGYEDAGQLTEAVRRRPYRVILLDEVEKAHPDVFNVLLQLLDDGRLTDGQGRTVDFRNVVVIMTSNLGSTHILDVTLGPDELRERVMVDVRGHFRPEFLNRIDETVIFDRLGRTTCAPSSTCSSSGCAVASRSATSSCASPTPARTCSPGSGTTRSTARVRSSVRSARTWRTRSRWRCSRAGSRGTSSRSTPTASSSCCADAGGGAERASTSARVTRSVRDEGACAGTAPLGAADAVVVGAGPNGLAAALTLARAGFRVTVLEAADEPGGGTRSFADPVPTGSCTTTARPCIRSGSARRTCARCRSTATASSGCSRRSPARIRSTTGTRRCCTATSTRPSRGSGRTVRGGGAVRRAVARLRRARRTSILGPLVRVPRHPLVLARNGLLSLAPATLTAARFAHGLDGPGAALFGGVAAHAVAPLDSPGTTGVATMLIAAGHARGWPVARGGSQSIWRAMVAMLEELGGEVVTGVRVRSMRDLPRTRVALFDTDPGSSPTSSVTRPTARAAAAARLAARDRGRVQGRPRRARRRAVGGRGRAARRHAAPRRHVHRDRGRRGGEQRWRHAGAPYVLVSQPAVADPSRRVGDVEPVWAYAHVPADAGRPGCAGPTPSPATRSSRSSNASPPGSRDRIVATHVTTPADFAAGNPNLVGGDITGGALTLRQLVARPRFGPTRTRRACRRVPVLGVDRAGGRGARHVRPPCGALSPAGALTR
jgi:phytoene dehydrogenase-like protein